MDKTHEGTDDPPSEIYSVWLTVTEINLSKIVLRACKKFEPIASLIFAVIFCIADSFDASHF